MSQPNRCPHGHTWIGPAAGRCPYCDSQPLTVAPDGTIADVRATPVMEWYEHPGAPPGVAFPQTYLSDAPGASPFPQTFLSDAPVSPPRASAPAGSQPPPAFPHTFLSDAPASPPHDMKPAGSHPPLAFPQTFLSDAPAAPPESRSPSAVEPTLLSDAPPARPTTPGTIDPLARTVLSEAPAPGTVKPSVGRDSASSTSMLSPVGLAPPGYELQGTLGRGGMGIVYKARDLKLNRPVALKMLLAGGHAQEMELSRFRAEAEAIARLEHPGIVGIYEIGEHGGKPYIALEYVAGGTLSHKVAGNPQPPMEAARMLQKLATAMAAAHAAGVVHRDLKPGNILLTADGEPKVTDFGLAKRIDEDSSQTHTGAILGTPSYMPPEQAAGRIRDIGPAADVYALGAILYDMLTGRPPFKADTAMNTAMQVIHSEVVPPSRLMPKLPKDLETICLKCLEKDFRRRYVSADALADDLQRYIDGRPITARPVGSVERAVKWAKRRPAIAALLAGIVGVTAVGFAAVTSQWLQAEAARQVAVDERKKADDATIVAVAEKAAADIERAEAQKQRGIAVDQKKVAEGEREMAKKERAVAVAEKDRADRFFGEAQKVIESLTHVGQIDLAEIPGMEAVRRDVLTRALAFYKDLAAQQTDDPALKKSVARAALLVGDLRESLGQSAEAQAAYRDALARYDALPDAADASAGRAAARNNLAILLQAAGTATARAEAAKLYADAVAIKEQLARATPTDPVARRSLAQSYNNLGTFHQSAGDRPKAGAYFDKAVGELDPLKESPGRAEDRRELALALVNRAAFRHTGGDAPGATADYAAAEKLLRGLPDAAAPPNRRELARTLVNSAALLQGDADAAAGIERYTKAVAVLADLADDFPLAADYKLELAVARRNRAALYRRSGDATAAAADLTAAADLLAPLTNAAAKLEQVRTDAERAQLAAEAAVTKKLGPDDPTVTAAVEMWAKAVAAIEAQRKAAPGDAIIRREHARLAGNYGLFLAKCGPVRAAAAEQQLKTAVALFAETATTERAADPAAADRAAADRAYFGATLAGVFAGAGKAKDAADEWGRTFAVLEPLAETGDYAAAGRVIGQLARQAGKDWPHAAPAAAVAGRCAGRAAADPTLSEPFRGKLAEAYIDMAWELLKRLKAAGKLDAKWAWTLPALDPVRGRPEFAREFGPRP